MTEDLPGVDLGALERWLDAERPGLRQGQLSATLLTGGKSNLTYRVSDGAATWALRRPPLGHVLPTAHDMAREYRVISAMQHTDVPVAPPIAASGDTSIIGAPFYLMGYVDGMVFERADVVAELTQDEARRSGEILVDTLAELHAVDPVAVGLEDFGRPLGFLDRQLKRWHSQWVASETRPLPAVTEAIDALSRRVPTPARTSVVHGDYRAANAIYRRDLSGIAAVVDWEMATVADPMTDLGLLFVYHALAAEGGFALAPMRTRDGFLAPSELARRYADRTSSDLSDLSWYVAFGYFKLAVISETIRHRHLAGQTLGEGFDDVGDSVPALAAASLQALTDLSL